MLAMSSLFPRRVFALPGSLLGLVKWFVAEVSWASVDEDVLEAVSTKKLSDSISSSRPMLLFCDEMPEEVLDSVGEVDEGGGGTTTVSRLLGSWWS